MENKKGFAINIEGVDGSGKHTVSTHLAERISILGNKICEVVSFPQHGTNQGLLVDEFLYRGLRFSGDTIERANREGMLYAIDRMVTMTAKDKNGRSKLDEYNEGKLFIFDRYLTSNFLHRCNEMGPQELAEYMELMEIIEYDVIGIPKPDLVFILKTRPELALENIEKRGREKDENETLENIQKSYAKIEELANKREEYITIECCFEDSYGKWSMRDVDSIVMDILTKMREHKPEILL